MSTNIPTCLMFNIRLKELREEKGYNITQMAKLIGISRKMYSKYEGYTEGQFIEKQYAYPSASLLPRFAEVLDTTTDYLLGISNYRHIKPNGLLEYILENDNAEFCRYLERIERSAQQEASYKIDVLDPRFKDIKRKSDYIPTVKAIAKDINDFTPEQYHRNFVKMKKWLDEFGNEEFLMREAIKARIAYLNRENKGVVDPYKDGGIIE